MKIVEITEEDINNSPFLDLEVLEQECNEIWVSPHRLDIVLGQVLAHGSLQWDGEQIMCLRYTIDANPSQGQFPCITLYIWDQKNGKIPESLLKYSTRYIRYTINGSKYGYARLRVLIVPHLRIPDMESGE